MVQKKLKQSDFVIWYGENYHCTLMTVDNEKYELAFEPCDFGFDVALYRRDVTILRLVASKKCTEVINDYENDPYHQKPRSKDTWEKALRIGQQIITTFVYESDS